MHGMIGPSCAIADVKGDKATHLVGSHGTVSYARHGGDPPDMKEQNVRIIYLEPPDPTAA